MSAQLSENSPLQPVLRLVHCIQKERGASCALAGSLGARSLDSMAEEYPYKSNLRAARIASNSAISSFYRSEIWRAFRVGRDADDFDIAAKLFQVRVLVDGGGNDVNEYLFFHDVIVEFNHFLSKIVHGFVADELSRRKKDVQRKIDTRKLSSEARRSAKVSLSLLDLILSFVTLKESLGMERATLSGLMANVIHEADDENAEAAPELIKALKQTDPKYGARLNLIVNDLVMIVESQNSIMRDLRRQTGLDIRGKFDSSYKGDAEDVDELRLDGAFLNLLQLVEQNLMPPDEMIDLQNHIRKDFDIDGFQQAMTMEEFWSGITLYMDELHSMELFLLEELENCEGSFEDLDLLSLGKSQPSQSILDALGMSASSSASHKSVVEAVGGMTQDELKDALVSFVTQKGTKQPLNVIDTGSDTNVNGKTESQMSPLSSPRENERVALGEEWEISLYEVEFHKRIGRGSAGTTYLGRYCQQDVAVKVAATSDMGLDGWTSELSSLKKLHHTNIIRFMGAIYNPSPLTYCLVLEYCNGGDLSVALAGNTPPKFFGTVASGVAKGMFYLHKMGFMHRDIKPSNVLLSGDPMTGHFVAKLTDFGLAVRAQNASVTKGKREHTAETGTYRYMAPEVIRHESYDNAADVYSFGILMWEMITREKPFETKSQIEAAGAVALEGKRPPLPEETPTIVRTMIEKCWAEEPSERMKLDRIIEYIDELCKDIAAISWLDAPLGYPVYKEQSIIDNVDRPTINGIDVANVKLQRKKSFVSGLFRKKKK